jgi:hypothetical protein
VPLKEVMDRVESRAYSATLGVASGYRGFLWAMLQHPDTACLIDQMKTSQDLQQVLLRILVLASQKIDPEYEHPHDIAVAVYLRVLSLKDLEASQVAAVFVQQTPQFWWAQRVAAHLLSGCEAKSFDDLLWDYLVKPKIRQSPHKPSKQKPKTILSKATCSQSRYLKTSISYGSKIVDSIQPSYDVSRAG